MPLLKIRDSFLSSASTGPTAFVCLKRQRAFTLVEILVVVVILGLLAALTLPALNRSLAKGRTAKSLGQIHQIYTVISMHVAENDGNFPYAFGVSGLTGENNEKNDRLYWYNVAKVRLYPHATLANRSSLEGQNGYLVLTKQDLRNTVLRSPNAEKNWPAHVVSYGYNDRFRYTSGRSQKLGLFYNNSRTVLLADNMGGTHALTPDNSSTSGKLNPRNGASADNAADGSAIAVFLDGHSESLSAGRCMELNADKTHEFWGIQP
jgi:prepilin-type N-terminal cleavage/methylation domain-containing protein